MRSLLLSTTALLLLITPVFAQPHGNQGHGNRGEDSRGGGQERSNRVGKASVAPQIQDRAQAESRGQGRGQDGGDRGGDRGRGDERRGGFRNDAPPSTDLANRGERDSGERFRDRGDRDGGDRGFNSRMENRDDRNRRERFSSMERRDRDRRAQEIRPDRRSDFNRDGRTDYRRDFRRDGGPRRDFSGFRDYHRAYSAPRRFNVPYYRRPAGWYSHRWTFGEFLPAAFWARDYWLVDFEEYDLPPPPWGTVWVRVASDALLIDEDSGEIITIAYNIFY